MSSQRIRAGAGFFAAACAAGALVVPTALAAPADPNQPAAATVQKDADTTLTIHKCEQTDANGTAAGTGLRQDPADCNAMEGVTYKITRLDYDLSTQEGWTRLAAANGDVNTAASGSHKTATTFDGKTGADGQLVFDAAKTDVGAYLVQEISTAGAKVHRGGAVEDVKGAIPGADFIVTLPMTSPGSTNAWNYDVHVYPKNTLSGIEKKVVDTGKASGSGNSIEYTIDAAIPKVNVAGGEQIKRFNVIDQLDPRVQKGTGADQLNPRVAIVGTNAADLAVGADCAVTVAEGADGKNYLTVELTADGLTKIATARANGDKTTKVQVVLTATFAAGTSLDGGISNTAFLIPSDSPEYDWDKDKPTTPGANVPSTDPVVSKYGKVELSKKGTDTANLLQGASFQVYQCSWDGQKSTKPTLTDSDTADAAITPLTVKNQTTFTTETNGKVVIDALRANDWENGAAKVLTDADYYCLVETKAPDGYTLQAEPVPFRILAASADDKQETQAVDVTDVPKNAGFHLPLTGASGVVFLTVVGGLLVLTGAGIAYVNKRRQNH
ncbi:SpaH/EbpB family LPXTG-anchored major pilin [Actinomyces timonensis]|uniref:SpaH/EbpB family LPXTG-anchored major pilin n=1 Tax=Actinomyces timonensis TaxID=1288391 RepID=A0AAU8N3K1_9ACTO